MDLHDKFGLTRVLNAYDKATFLGGARVLPEIAEVVCASMGETFRVAELQEVAGEIIARETGAESGCVTACAAAAITLNVAACMSGADPERVAQLPDTDGMPSRAVMQAGHCVNFGAPVAQMARLSGADVITVGDEDGCTPEEILRALDHEDVACAVAVESYHTADYPGLGLREFIEIAHSAGVPVVVDAATQELRLREIMALGPDLVGCSAHKYLVSTTAGIVAGRADLLEAVLAQGRGIGRTMKVGKEGIFGVLAAWDTPMQRDTSAWSAHERRKCELVIERIKQVEGLSPGLSPDPNGCPFDRVRVAVDEAISGFSARSLREALRQDDPAVEVRVYGRDPGAFYINTTELTDSEVETVCEHIEATLRRARGSK
ncbi:MAG: aminotransferase class V-fold PLP-dependent enzyme [Armatimonadota bacterium]